MSERVKVPTKAPEAKKENVMSQTRETESSQSMNSPGDRILFLQRTIGNQAVQRLFNSGAIQAKLRIGQPNDKYEQEADRISEQVMRMPEPQLQRQPLEEEEEEIQAKPIAEQITPLVQRQIEEEEEEEPIQTKALSEQITPLVQRQEEEEEEEIQTKPLAEQITPLAQRQVEEEEEALRTKKVSNLSSEVTPEIAANISALKGSDGHPLPKTVRDFFEPRFGYDFSQVRIHADTKAVDSARELNAYAYTVGQNVVFGPGEYAPGTTKGKKLLAHELTHTIQQGANKSIQKKLTISNVPGIIIQCAIPTSINDVTMTKASTVNDSSLESNADAVQENIPSIQKVIHVSNNTNVIQRRRIPTHADITRLVSGTNLPANRSGLARLVRHSMAQLNIRTQRPAVRERARGALSSTQFSALPRWQQDLRLAQAIYDLHQRLRHGDPRLYMTGIRPTTLDAANLATLVRLANEHLMAIVSGAHDTSIGQVFGIGHVFGTSNIDKAKTNYTNAKTKMNSLHPRGIVTDRSGYVREVHSEGWSDGYQIMVSDRTLDNPTDNESIITLIHESMHAGNNSGNNSIDDRGYISTAIFTRMSERDKLRNAAHYEVVPYRILGGAYAYLAPPPLPVFIPASTAAPLTATQRGVRQASERFRKAWGVAGNLHSLYVNVHLNPTRWDVPLPAEYEGAHLSARFQNTLPFWSKVEKMTIHRKTTISPTSADPSRQPVSRIDVALSEGVVRKLSQAMLYVPQTQSAAQTFINSKTTASQRAAIAGNAARIGNLLLRLVLHDIRYRYGRITGTFTRDLAVVRRLARADRDDFSEILRPRAPSAFPYP